MKYCNLQRKIFCLLVLSLLMSVGCPAVERTAGRTAGNANGLIRSTNEKMWGSGGSSQRARPSRSAESWEAAEEDDDDDDERDRY